MRQRAPFRAGVNVNQPIGRQTLFFDKPITYVAVLPVYVPLGHRTVTVCFAIFCFCQPD